jgi:hypothetical protein
MDLRQRLLNPGLKKEIAYSKFSSHVVLGCILLHPAILAYMQLKNSQGVPPQSFVNYVGEDLKLAVMIGSFSLLLFLSYEFFKRMKENATVKKHWGAVSLSQSLAMLLIFIHGLRLGQDITDGWFRFVWILYGVALIPCLYVIHREDFREK